MIHGPEDPGASERIDLPAFAAVLGGGSFLGAFAGVGVEHAFAQADVFRGGFDEFVGIDVFDGAFE